jgi:hypothetical protein
MLAPPALSAETGMHGCGALGIFIFFQVNPLCVLFTKPMYLWITMFKPSFLEYVTFQNQMIQ